MARDDAYYITTPIYYVNDLPHIGHAYTTLACDVLARFMRLDGKRVKFLTGTDEHGQKVEKSAAAAGEAPKAFVDRVSGRFRELTAAMNFSNDDFIRTTEERHVRSVQHLWMELKKRGEIYLGKYAGWYSVRDEAFYAESEVVEQPDGAKVGPTGAPVEWVEEESYFFRLSNWGERLLEYYAREGSVAPESRKNEVVSFVKGGLKDLSVSRTGFEWGIPVPDDPGHVIYVWLDALANYISAVGYPDTSNEEFKTFWPAVHLVGKDILRFHAVYWPAFLMGAGLPPPARVFAHGWWTNEGQKISKSLGNIIDPFEIVERYGLDPVRYFLLREVPFGNDGDFSHTAMVSRTNADLANGIGNLAQRTLTLIHRNCEAQVPEPGKFTDEDLNLINDGGTRLARSMRGNLQRQEFQQALQVLMAVVSEADSYIDSHAPWALRKTDPARMNTVLYVLAETIRNLAILLQPFTPEAAARLLDQLAVPGEARDFAHLGEAGALVPGTPLPKPEGVFPRYVGDEEDGKKT